MSDANSNERKVPKTFKQFITQYPMLGDSHEAIAKYVDHVGPLDAKTMSLVKIGISLGAGLDSAVRSHVRRAMEHGATKEEIEQAILLAFNTLGLPRTVAAWSWAQTQFQRGV